MRRASNPNYLKFGAKETIVAFATDRGQLRTNDAGEFFYREFTDGRFCCAAPDLERKLIEAGVRAGQQVGITRETYNRSAIWKVRPIAPITPITPASRQATSNPKPKAHEFPERVYAKLEPPPPAFPECEPVATPAPASTVNLNGGTLGTPQTADAYKSDNPTLITRCMLAAVDAAAKATAHGQAIGFPVTFGAPEIEAIAVTLYINSTPGSGYRKPNNQARSHYNGNGATGASA